MNKKLCYYILLFSIKLIICFELDDFPVISTESSFLSTRDQLGRSNNQTDDIVSTIYSTVASVSKDINRLSSSNNDPVASGTFLGREEEQDCRKSTDEEEFIIRPSHRVCDYLVTRNHSGICSLEISLTGWDGDCRESWLEAGGKLECGTLTGTRRLNFDRSAISLRLRSSDGILRVKQIPCSTQVTPPSLFTNNTNPDYQPYPAPYIPPNLRPSTHSPDETFPVSIYVPDKESDFSIHKRPINNEIPHNKIDAVTPIYYPNMKYPVLISQQTHRDQAVYSSYRPNSQNIYPGMSYGPPECNKNSGVVIHSPGYPNTSPLSDCYLFIQSNSRLCSPFIYFDYFEVGNSYGSACQNSRLEIGRIPFCGCLSGISWQVPNYVFSSDGSLTLHFRGQGRFLLTVYYNTCQQGYNPYPPNQRLPWRCGPGLPSSPSPPIRPYPINPYPPVQPPRPYPSPQPPNPYPPTKPPHPWPVPIPKPSRPLPPQPVYPEPPRPFPEPEPKYPYPPKQPPPYPPFPYPSEPNPPPQVTYPTPTSLPQPFPPPRPQPFPPPRPIPQPQPFPPPHPIPQPQSFPDPYPTTYPEPYPHCQVIQMPQGSISCAPIQPQSYCYRFEPPKRYCQMIIKLEKIAMSSNQNCKNEYLTTGKRNPRICQESMENIPIYVDRGGYLQGKLMPGSIVRASFEGLPCSCNVDYRQTDFTIRATPPHNICHYNIHKANEGVCSMEVTLENIDLECGIESLIIDGKSYCGLRAYEKLEIPFLDPKLSIKYERSGQTQKPGSFSLHISQRSRCVQPFSAPTGRGIKYTEDCILPLSSLYGVIDYPGTTYSYTSKQILKCSYIFPPKAGYCYVRLDFDEVDIPNTLDCTRYYMDINGIKYCGNTLSSSTKVLELDEINGNKISYAVDRTSKWRFTFTLLQCKQEILARAQNGFSSQFNMERFS